jgi:uncharacterized protein
MRSLIGEGATLKILNAVMTGDTFVLQFLLPNFFFHIATAHDILRHNGVKIGKRDYLGQTS